MLGNKSDELAIHILACMMNLKVVVVTKTGFWCTVMDCDPLSADVVLVYLGKSTFRDTVPIPIPTKTLPIPIDDDTELNEHEETKVCDPNHRVTQSMGRVPHVNTPSPSPHPHPPLRWKNQNRNIVRRGKHELWKKKNTSYIDITGVWPGSAHCVAKNLPAPRL